MKRPLPPLILASLFPAAAGLALYLLTWTQSGRFTILDHGFRFDPVLFLGLTILCAFGLALLWIGAARLESGPDRTRLPNSIKSGLVSWFPLLFLLLAPILLNDYMDRYDLRRRLFTLGLAVLAALIYLKAVDLAPALKGLTGRLKRWEAKFAAFPIRKKLVLLFLAAFLIYNLATLALLLQGMTFSGDEPNYLMTTHSLYKDGDINLANNYARKDYFHFYSRKDNPRLKLGIYARYGKKGQDYIFPINLPGLSVLILPRYALSRLFEGGMRTYIIKGSLAFWAALLGLQVYLLILRLGRNERRSLAVWFLYSFTAPVLFYATHLYPEVFIAFCSVLIYRRLTDDRPLSTRTALALGFLLSTFLWFGVKYNFLFGPLLVFGVYHIFRRNRDWRRAAAFAAFPALSLLLFAFFVWTLYGTFSPFAVYEGVLTAEQAQSLRKSLLALPVLQRVETFFDFFLDQRDGLLLYAPFAAFALLGAIEMFRRRRRDLYWLLFLTLPFLLNYAFFTHRQGASPQARVLMPFSWAGALLIGYFLAYNVNKLFAYLFKAAALASLALAGLLLAHPPFLYQPTTHEFTDRASDLFVYLSNVRFLLPGVLPSFIKIKNIGYWPNYAWILGLALFVVWYARAKKGGALRPAFHRTAALVFLGASVILWCLHPRTVPYGATTVNYTPQTSLGFYAFPWGRGVVLKNDGTLYLHEAKEYTILFGARKKLGAIKLSFGNDKGDYAVEARFFDLPLLEERTSSAKKEIVFNPPASYPYRNLGLYLIKLRLRHLSEESMQLDPYPFRIVPVKE
jgi:hypothetical protein